ncbi:MAG: glycosyl transferase family 1, partial [Paludibacter sp.]
WIADFRDPWTEIFYFKDLHLTYFAKKYHHYLEKKVLQKADDVITVSSQWQKDFQKFRKETVLISNGFDHEDYIIAKEREDNKYFTISHIGTLTYEQNPFQLWKVLNVICLESTEFSKKLRIRLVGKVDKSVITQIKKYNLDDKLSFIDYIPHSEVVKEQQNADILLLLLVHSRKSAKGILPAKLFEYLAVQRPILAIGSTESNVADVLKDTKAGCIVDFDDKEILKKTILSYFNDFQKGNLNNLTSNIEKYTRQNLTKELVKLLDNS